MPDDQQSAKANGSTTRFRRQRGFTLNSDKLVSLYQRRGWSQQDFAMQAGLDARTIAKVKRGGACDARTLQILAATLGVEPAELMASGEQALTIDDSEFPVAESPSIDATPSVAWQSSFRILESWKVIDLREPVAAKGPSFAYVWERFRIQKLSDCCDPIAFPYLTWGKGIELTTEDTNVDWRKIVPTPGDLLHSNKCWELVIRPPAGPEKLVFETSPLQLKYIDAFHGPGQQWWQSRIAYEVQSMIIQVLFPSSRPCSKLEATWSPPGQNRFLTLAGNEPFLLADGTMASWHILMPPIGSYFKIAWNW